MVDANKIISLKIKPATKQQALIRAAAMVYNLVFKVMRTQPVTKLNPSAHTLTHCYTPQLKSNRTLRLFQALLIPMIKIKAVFCLKLASISIIFFMV
jgi:hypothetical protein